MSLPDTQPVTCNSLGTRLGLVMGTGGDGQLQVPHVQSAAGPPCPSQPDDAAATVHGCGPKTGPGSSQSEQQAGQCVSLLSAPQCTAWLEHDQQSCCAPDTSCQHCDIADATTLPEKCINAGC